MRRLFVGQWVPTILILGLYNKLVKQHGSDHFHALASDYRSSIKFFIEPSAEQTAVEHFS